MSDRIFSGKYVVQEEIAKGGMGVIYKALDRTLNRFVAIKVVHEHFSGDASFTERFMREARAMALLHHENIITIFGVEEDRGVPFIVMEYFLGTDLRATMKQRSTLSVRESVGIALQVANGLAFAHSQGVVHRDIKPANILVDTRGRVKLTDFGIATALGEASITSTGQIIGTPEYMSPEQAGGMTLDGRTDLYSLGIVMHEMLVGQTPFRNMPKTSVITKLLDPGYDIPLAFSPDVPSGVQAIVEDLVRRDPEHRTGSAGIVVGQLRECFESLPLQDADAAPTVVTTPFLADTFRTTRVSSAPPSVDSPSIPSLKMVQLEKKPEPQPQASQTRFHPTLPGAGDEATDILARPTASPQPSLPPANAQPVQGKRPLIPIGIGILSAALILSGLAYVFSNGIPFTDHASHTTQTPDSAITTPQKDESPDSSGTRHNPVSADSAQLQARIEQEQRQLEIDQARVTAKQNEAEVRQTLERSQAAQRTQIAEEQRKKSMEAERAARTQQLSEQRNFSQEQKRLAKEKELAAKQAQAADAQRRKAQEDLRIAKEREALEAKRGSEEAHLQQLHVERQRLERAKELAEEQARLAEAQRLKIEEDARQAQARHDAEQQRLQAQQQRMEKEQALAAQRAAAQEEEKRKAEEATRLAREQLQAQQKRLQAETERLEKEQVAAQKARVELEERRKAQEEARVARERYEADQQRLQAQQQRMEKEQALAAQRAAAQEEEQRKAEEATRLAREQLQAQQKRLQAETERLEKEREVADQKVRKELEVQPKGQGAATLKTNKEELSAKLSPDALASATSSRRQLGDLLEEFKVAYEAQDLEAVARLSDMGNDRLSFVRTMFSNYRTIQVSIQGLTVTDDEASAMIIHEVLIDNRGDTVKPSPILRSARIKIHRTGQRWNKIEW